MEINDWSDIKRFDYASQNETSLDANKDSENVEEPKAFGGLSGWNDLKQFDDDHDNEWFEAEEKVLAEKYGGNYLKVKYGDHRRVIYFCELCYAECNAKKSLDLHCSGMKHLKKKDTYEKEGKPQTHLEMQGTKDRPPKPKKIYSSRRDSRDYNRRDSRSRSRERRWSPGRRGRSRSTDRYSPRNRSMDREPFSFNPRGRTNGGGPGDFRNDSFHPGPFGYPPPSFSSNFGNRDNREPPPPALGSGNEGRPFADNLNGSYSSGPPSTSRQGFYDDNFPPGGFLGRPPIPLSPPKFNQNAIPIQPELSMDKANLPLNPAGILLQKMYECCVNSSDDADLALNVVASLVKSLGEYCKKSGENKIAELLMEAELKVSTVKALNVSMKMFSSFTDSSVSKYETSASSEAFIEGMKQVLIEKGESGVSAAFNSSDSIHKAPSSLSKSLFGDAFDKYTATGPNPSRPNY